MPAPTLRLSSRSRKILLSTAVVVAGLTASGGVAYAAKHVLYLHGRSMGSFPAAAFIGTTSAWTHVTMNYNGSARLNDAGVRTQIRDEIANRCTASDCVIVCYSAGCARMLLGLEDLRAQGRYPPRLLWTSAAASAAGGTRLAELSTKKGIRLLAKILKVLGINVPSASAIDYDLGRNSMRQTWGFIQNSSQVPVYHLAGSRDICTTIRILFIKIKLCGNKRFPGRKGDGAVPVHSAAGYSTVGTRVNHNDGNPKYVNRAYEQVPLFSADHASILGPMVATASLRLAVNKNATCAHSPASTASTEASIVYEDADGAIHEESRPQDIIRLCGQSAWNGDPTAYGSCLGTYGCCDNFSNGVTNGCTCGEALCLQQKRAGQSFFTGPKCSGIEFSPGVGSNFQSHDGLGTSGNQLRTYTARSTRGVDGICRALVRRVDYNGFCPEFYETTKSYSQVRRVYRVGVSSLPQDPNTQTWFRGYVVQTQTRNAWCP